MCPVAVSSIWGIIMLSILLRTTLITGLRLIPFVLFTQIDFGDIIRRTGCSINGLACGSVAAQEHQLSSVGKPTRVSIGEHQLSSVGRPTRVSIREHGTMAVQIHRPVKEVEGRSVHGLFDLGDGGIEVTCFSSTLV